MSPTTAIDAQHSDDPSPSLLHQQKAVWAVAFASVIAFMGIGLVDPILEPISEELNATPSQVLLLFTSHMLVTGVAMLITGAVSSRIGAKRSPPPTRTSRTREGRQARACPERDIQAHG